MKNLKILLLSLSIAFIASGCGSSGTYINNIDNSNFLHSQTNKVSLIENAITIGATKRGWQITKQNQGLLTASITMKRKFLVVANISYNNTGYKISYNNSENLNYNSEKNTIHKSYNKWIKNLERSINKQLSKVGTPQYNATINSDVTYIPSAGSTLGSGTTNSNICEFSFTGSLSRGRIFTAKKVMPNLTKQEAVVKAVPIMANDSYVISSTNAELGMISAAEHKRGYQIPVNLFFTEHSENNILGTMSVHTPAWIASNAKSMKKIMCDTLNRVEK